MCELRNSVVYMHVETCTHVGMFFSLKRKGNPVTCDNMDETIGYCPKGISQTKTNSSWYHFYVEIKKKKKSKHLETVESGCQGIGEIGRVWLKDDIS